MTVLFVSGDLMFGSQFAFAAQRVGARLVTAARLALVRELVATEIPRLAVIDLVAAESELTELVATLQALEPRPLLIAYGPHVHEARLHQAAELGCDRVLTRGQFHAQMGTLLDAFANEA